MLTVHNAGYGTQESCKVYPRKAKGHTKSTARNLKSSRSPSRAKASCVLNGSTANRSPLATGTHMDVGSSAQAMTITSEVRSLHSRCYRASLFFHLFSSWVHLITDFSCSYSDSLGCPRPAQTRGSIPKLQALPYHQTRLPDGKSTFSENAEGLARGPSRFAFGLFDVLDTDIH